MNNIHKTGCNSPLINLTSRNAPRINLNASNMDFTGSNDKATNRGPEFIDLTDDEIQHFSSNIPVIDLNCDNDQPLNSRIPVIDLTNDDVNDITHQTQCIDLTHSAASSSKQAIKDFNLRAISVGTNRSIVDIQYFNTNTPLIDLTCENDQFPNCTIQDIDITNDSQYITQQLQSFDMTDGRKQNINECIPSINVTNHSYQNIDRIISANDLTSNKDYNVRRPIIDLILNDRAIRKPADVEMPDFSYDSAPTGFQKDANLNYNVTENHFLKCNESSNLKVMHSNIFSNMEKLCHRKEILEKNSRKNNFEDKRERVLSNYPILNNFEVRKEPFLSNRSIINNFENKTKTILTNRPLRNFENRKERILTKNPQISNSESRKETVLTHNSQTNNPGEKYLRQEKFKQLSRRNSSDFPKPAHRPIPLRHSLGRSTVNTSPNTSIEYIEGSEDQSRILTVSAIIRRKKSKSNAIISENALPKSKKQPASRDNKISFGTFKGFLRKFWILLLLTFIRYSWF